MPDELAEIKAELRRRGALPQANGTRAASGAPSAPTGGSDAYLVILAEAVNHLAKSVSEMRASTAKQTEDFLKAQANVQPRIRTIERDENGNIARIIEE